MKKLFVAVLALAALAACNKDNEFVPEVSKDAKSITVAIENSAATRAGVTAPGVHNEACAEAKDMNILFADASGKILKVLPLVGTAPEGEAHATEYAVGVTSTDENDNTVYLWHNVPASINQIAVVRDTKGDVEIVEGETTLDDVKDAADDEDANLERELDDIFLYAEDTLSNDGGDCVVYNGVEYKIWTASVRVAPLFTRLEITNIQCDDLGETNTDDDINSFGYDELVINSLTWTAEKGVYTIAPATEGASLVTLYSDNNNTAAANNTQTDASKRFNYWTADGLAPVEAGVQSKVWSWNVLPQKFGQMDLVITVDAYDYVLVDRNVALKVIDLSTAENATEDNDFELAVENIYRIDLSFDEGDLTGKEGRCVQVTVEIAPWTVNTVYPVYGK